MAKWHHRRLSAKPRKLRLVPKQKVQAAWAAHEPAQDCIDGGRKRVSLQA
jgi:hypothetical protein